MRLDISRRPDMKRNCTIMRHFRGSQIKKCEGKTVSLFMIALMIVLACIGVILQLAVPVVRVGDSCVQSICNFDDPSLPTDISCLNDTDCFSWSHP